jgi:hypothetical protein
VTLFSKSVFATPFRGWQPRSLLSWEAPSLEIDASFGIVREPRTRVGRGQRILSFFLTTQSGSFTMSVLALGGTT